MRPILHGMSIFQTAFFHEMSFFIKHAPLATGSSPLAYLCCGGTRRAATFSAEPRARSHPRRVALPRDRMGSHHLGGRMHGGLLQPGDFVHQPTTIGNLLPQIRSPDPTTTRFDWMSRTTLSKFSTTGSIFIGCSVRNRHAECGSRRFPLRWPGGIYELRTSPADNRHQLRFQPQEALSRPTRQRRFPCMQRTCHGTWATTSRDWHDTNPRKP